MTVLIAYNSFYVCSSFAGYLSDLENIRILSLPFDADAVMLVIEKEHPDIIITDPILMGDKRANLLGEIKRRASSIKLIVLSIFEFPQYRRDCLLNGADYYFKLPEELERFRNTIMGLANA
ncbi:MAG: hypothetical protein WAO19_03440 [Candidatus Kryptoniota bacterium]